MMRLFFCLLGAIADAALRAAAIIDGLLFTFDTRHVWDRSPARGLMDARLKEIRAREYAKRRSDFTLGVPHSSSGGILVWSAAGCERPHKDVGLIFPAPSRRGRAVFDRVAASVPDTSLSLLLRLAAFQDKKVYSIRSWYTHTTRLEA